MRAQLLGALRRLEQLIQEAVVTVPRALIAETIDLIAVLSGARIGAPTDRTRHRRRALNPDGDYRITPAFRTHIGRTDMINTTKTLDAPHCLSATTVAVGSLMLAPAAHAAGSSMPWEQPLQQILQSIEGPVAKILAVIIIIVTGLTLAFGDTSGGFRRLIQIVFGLSIAFAASSFFLSFFSFGGGALV